MPTVKRSIFFLYFGSQWGSSCGWHLCFFVCIKAQSFVPSVSMTPSIMHLSSASLRRGVGLWVLLMSEKGLGNSLSRSRFISSFARLIYDYHYFMTLTFGKEFWELNIFLSKHSWDIRTRDSNLRLLAYLSPLQTTKPPNRRLLRQIFLTQSNFFVWFVIGLRLGCQRAMTLAKKLF